MSLAGYLGSTPFGVGTPVAAPLPATKGPALSRFINSGTGDYEIEPDVGQFRSMPTTRQRVLLIAATEFGSSTVMPQLGIRRPKKRDESFERRMRAEIRVAFRQLSDVERVIRIDSVDIVNVNSGRSQVTVTYTDLTLLAPDQGADVTFTV